MSANLFDFWSVVGPSEKIHPADRRVLRHTEHGFNLNCLPACYMGPLKNAPVVLLYLSPGFSDEDLQLAKTHSGQQRYMRIRAGLEPLPGPDEHKSAHKWWASRTKRFGAWADLKNKIAILDIGAYHSGNFGDGQLLAALPSSRVCLDWAQNELFPQAEKGERLVVCLRAAKYWGLGKKQQHGKALFVPPTTRHGHMREGEAREKIIKTAVKFLA